MKHRSILTFWVASDITKFVVLTTGSGGYQDGDKLAVSALTTSERRDGISYNYW